MATCHFCGSKKDKYKCKDCGKSFCFEHTGSTDVFYCKNHPNVKLNRSEYALQDKRCHVIEKSSCPKCKADLRVVHSKNGNKSVECTVCNWNSREGTPRIISKRVENVLNEVKKHQLARSTDLCGKKLRYDKGEEFCLNCLIEFAKKQREVLFPELKRFRLDPASAARTLHYLLREDLIEGMLDEKKQLFVYITEKEKAKLLKKLQKQGYIDLETIQKKINIRQPTAMFIIIDFIRNNSLKGTFTKDQSRYYLEGGLTQALLNDIKTTGRVAHEDLAEKYDVYEDNVKNYIMRNILKNQLVPAYFADRGNTTVLTSKLEKEIEEYCKSQGEFQLDALGKSLGIATELARKMLFGSIQKGVIRGVFTQNKEFITEDELTEKIKRVARAYRKSPLKDMAKQFAITERKVEEVLTTLISRGSVAGYIDRENRIFIGDKDQPITKFGAFSKPETSSPNAMSPSPSSPKGDIEVVRQYDFVGGQLHFKVVVRNKSNMAIHDIKVILDVPSSYRKARELINISVIDPGNTHGVDFYLEPRECGISSIGGTVLYKDAMGQTHSIQVQKKDVQIKCPLVIKTLDTIEDCQKAIESLPSDARAFLISDLPGQMAYSAAYRAVSKFDTRNVASYEQTEGTYEAEAWFSSEAKVTGGRIIIRVYFNGANSTLEMRVWCNEAGQLTGLLAKIIEYFFNEINMMRKIKAEERNKTVDVMAITRNLMEISDICMLRYRAKSAKLKLEDIHTRLQRIGVQDEKVLQKIYDWIKKLEEKYPGDDDMLEDEDGDALDHDVESFQQVLNAKLGV